jgi:hypothetical protein
MPDERLVEAPLRCHRQNRRVSDGTRTRGRRDHNPSKAVLFSADAAYQPALSDVELRSVALNLDPA